MNAQELLKKVRKIEIKTKALSHQIFAGEYHSAFKGRGMAFSEVREYQYGDDVRNMDWNVTARMSAPYVKVFEEERELTVVLLIDISRSGLFGTVGETKRELVAEIAATLAFSAMLNNDKVGALFFSDTVEKFIPPKKGRSHLLHIIREILEYTPEHDGTDIGEALRYLTNAIKRRCTAFVLSDMLDVDADGAPRYEDALKVAVKTPANGPFRTWAWSMSRTPRPARGPGSTPPPGAPAPPTSSGSAPRPKARRNCSTATRWTAWTPRRTRIMSRT